MGLEAATFISQLNAAWPIGASDPKAQGDDHLRLLKSVLQATFPNASAAITLSGFAIPTVAADVTAPSAGVLNTALRSDARLQLSQAITPVWTGQHVFSAITNGGALRISSVSPQFFWSETDAAVDEKEFRVVTNGKNWQVQALADDFLSQRTYLSLTRGTGLALASVNIGNVTDNAPVNFLGTGTASFTGTVKVSNVDPRIQIVESDAGADLTFWDMAVSGAIFSLRTRTDANGAGRDFLAVTRGATTAIANMDFGNVTNNPTFNFLGTGLLSVGGAQNIGGALTIGGVTKAPNGAVGAPAYSYTNDATAGEYRIGAGNIGRAIGGALVFDWLAAASGGARVADPAGTMTIVGYRSVPRSTTATTLAIGDVGKCVAITAAINIPISVFAAGDCLSIYNDSAGALNLTISAGTLRLAGTTTTGTRSIAARGMCTIWFNVGGATPEVIASGNVT